MADAVGAAQVATPTFNVCAWSGASSGSNERAHANFPTTSHNSQRCESTKTRGNECATQTLPTNMPAEVNGDFVYSAILAGMRPYMAALAPE